MLFGGAVNVIGFSFDELSPLPLSPCWLVQIPIHRAQTNLVQQNKNNFYAQNNWTLLIVAFCSFGIAKWGDLKVALQELAGTDMYRQISVKTNHIQ